MLRSTTSNWFGVAPAWLVIGIFGLLPMFIMLAISFMVQDPYGGVEWGFSTEAYVQFLFERDLDDSLILNTIYVNIVARSIGLAAMTTILCRGLNGAGLQEVLAVPPDFVPRIAGPGLVRLRSQTVYYVLSRMKTAARMLLDRRNGG